MQSFWRVDVTLRALENELCVTEGDCVIRGKANALAHPGGRCTTTANTPGVDSSEAMGTVSTHLVNDPHRWTCRIKVQFTMSALHGQQAHEDSLPLAHQTAR